MPVTLEQLAKVAGVSISTVSRALNNSRHTVNEETGQRIWTLAKELGYRPNLVARSLKTERTHTIGIIVDDIASLSRPTLTGVRMPCYEMGQASAKLLLSLLEKQRETPNSSKSLDVPESAETIKIQGQLIVRESGGAEEGRRLSDKYHSHAQPHRRLMSRRRP